MTKRLVSIGIIGLIVFAGFVGFITFKSNVVRASNIWYVGSGAGNDSANIQGGVDLAGDGDTVFVYSGTYIENLIILITINLTGEGRDTTIIDGGGSGKVVEITANLVNITGFTVTGSGSDEDSGIKLNNAQNCKIIKNNISSNNRYGIHLYSSSNNTITDNNITNNYDGIYQVFSSNNNITHNNISSNMEFCMFLYGSSNNIIADNNVSLASGGIYLYSSDYNNISYNNAFEDHNRGIKLDNSNNNIIFYNNISGTVMGGILLSSSENNSIFYNKISSNNYDGISLGSSSNNYITYNLISSNNWDGIGLWLSSNNSITFNNISNNGCSINLSLSSNNIIYHNNIINNTVQAYDDTDNNSWNETYPFGGNYWSDYNGIDLNSTPTQDVPPPDGIGDTPYIIDGNSKDNYPLMEPVFQSTPSEPRNLQALIGNSYTNLTWEIPFFDAGSAIIGYNIYKNDTAGVYAFVPAGKLWFNDTGLINGLTYTYNVSAINSHVEGLNATISTTPGTIPSEPVNLQVKEGYGYVNISWDPPISDGGYSVIEYRIYRNGTIGSYATVSSGQLWFNDTNVINGTTYTYNITALNVIGEGPNTSNILGTPIAPVSPSEPQNPQTDSGDSYVNITWNPPLLNIGPPIIGYNIYRNGTTGIYDTVSANQFWFNDTNVFNDLMYTYNITAVNIIGEGLNSIDVIGTPSVPTIPSAPENLQAAEGDEYVNLTWNIPASSGYSPILGYYIYRNGTDGFYDFVPPDQLWYLDTNLTNGITYTYNVSAYNAIGESIQSADIAATPRSLPSTPINQIPICSISSPSSGTTLIGDHVINGTATDIDGTVQKVEIKIDDGEWILVEGTTSWSYNLDTSSLSDGTHSIKTRSYDGEDYSEEASIEFEVNNEYNVKEKSFFEENGLWILIIIIILIIVLLLVFFIMKNKKGAGEEKPEENEIEAVDKESRVEEELLEEKEDFESTEDD